MMEADEDHAMSRYGSWGSMRAAPVLLVAVAGCASDPWVRDGHGEPDPVLEAAGLAEGRRALAALPECGDDPAPPGASRVSGRLRQGDNVCTDMRCRRTKPCCNECLKDPVVVPDDRSREPVHTGLEGLTKIYGSRGVPQCAMTSYWVGLGAPRVRFTWFERPRHLPDVVGLCRLPESK